MLISYTKLQIRVGANIGVNVRKYLNHVSNKGAFCKYSGPATWHWPPGKVAQPPATATAASPATKNQPSALSDPRPNCSAVAAPGALSLRPESAVPRAPETAGDGAKRHSPTGYRALTYRIPDGKVAPPLPASGSACCRPRKDRRPPGSGYSFFHTLHLVVLTLNSDMKHDSTFCYNLPCKTLC